MNTASDPFSWWLEERGDENKNYFGWNQSKGAPSGSTPQINQSGTANNHRSTTTNKEDVDVNETWSLYDEYHAVETMDCDSYHEGTDTLPRPQHEIQSTSPDDAGNLNGNGSVHRQQKRLKQIHRELDCIFLNEVPTSMHYDREHHQLFVGTLMGNIHRFKVRGDMLHLTWSLSNISSQKNI